MWSVWVLLVLFNTLGRASTADSNVNCSVWFISPEILASKCCKMIPAVTQESAMRITKELKGKTFTDCEVLNITMDIFKLTIYDKTVYKTYMKNSMRDADFAKIYENKIDFCFDLVPKYVDVYAKKRKLDKCDPRSLLTFNCLWNMAYLECPPKKYTESSECNKLKTVLKECSENPDALVKAIETTKLKAEEE